MTTESVDLTGDPLTAIEIDTADDETGVWLTIGGVLIRTRPSRLSTSVSVDGCEVTATWRAAPTQEVLMRSHARGWKPQPQPRPLDDLRVRLQRAGFVAAALRATPGLDADRRVFLDGKAAGLQQALSYLEEMTR